VAWGKVTRKPVARWPLRGGQVGASCTRCVRLVGRAFMSSLVAVGRRFSLGVEPAVAPVSRPERLCTQGSTEARALRPPCIIENHP
jgi:hypothetical protein